MRLKNKVLRILVVSVMIGVFAPAVSLAEQGVYEDKVVVGAWMALSGVLATMGKQDTQAVRAYLNMINEEGGINGRTIEWIVEDDEYKPERTVAVARKLDKVDKVFAYVLCLGTGNTMAAYNAYVKQADIPIVGLQSTGVTVSQPPKRLIFAVTTSQYVENRAYVDYALKVHNAKKLGLLYQNDEFGQMGSEQCKIQAKKLGAKVVSEQKFETQTTDVTSQILSLKKANPDAVIVTSTGDRQAIILKEAAKFDYHPVWFFQAALNDPDVLELAGEAADGAHCSILNDPLDAKTPSMELFRKTMQKYYPGQTLTQNHQCSWTAIHSVVEAFKRMDRNNFTRENLIRTLEGFKGDNCAFSGVGPPVCYDTVDSGDIFARRGNDRAKIAKVVYIPELKKNRIIPVSGWIGPTR